jgi:hypothetical protein
MFNVALLTIHSDTSAVDNLKMTSSVLAALKPVRFFQGCSGNRIGPIPF